MAGLLDKLRALEVEKPREAPREKPAEERLYRRCDRFPLSLFGDFAEAAPGTLRALFGPECGKAFRKEEILFLDTETTGLSGGAGTVAFQVGIGYFSEDVFIVEQFLMRDYAAEEEMLRILSGIMSRFLLLCTFNGRTFDAPLLRSRFLMNRLDPDAIPALHADVLYPARRLWKLRLKTCTLGRLEEALLGVSREDDLPGSLVPQTYFQYLKDGDFAPLQKILDHNRQDIVSLAQLFYFACRCYNHPEAAREDEDLLSLAREMEKRGDAASARKCYRMLSRGAYRAEGFKALARGEKREGNVRAALKLYQTMLARGEEPAQACEALAKLCEHQLRDPAAALAYTRQALMLLAEPALAEIGSVQELQKALQYRYARLRRKCMTTEDDK